MVRSCFLWGQTGASLPHRGAFLERVPDFLKKAVLLVQTGHYEEALILAGPRLFGTRQDVPALLAQVEALRIMCGVERPFHARGSATGAFHTNASSLGSVGVLGAAGGHRSGLSSERGMPKSCSYKRADWTPTFLSPRYCLYNV